MQFLAMLTMLIDHVGLLFFPDQPLWRIIGRIAFPLYAYALAQGHQHTSSHSKYVIRLFSIAVVSQIPYQLVFDTNELNVVASLCVAAVLLRALDRLSHSCFSFILIVFVCFLFEIFPFEYGAYGLLLMLIFNYMKSGPMLVGMHLLLNLAALFTYGWILQLFSIIPTMLIVYGPNLWIRLESWRMPRWFWRLFYPAHLAVLALILYFIGK
ncbi:TraX family protein [Paenibacillus lentus]|uniref:Conjugal transfer protein TraX n=1 Tax=Paenibacillus lentus TaxID=1338368 RepID=A0A3S8RYR0_9BACL|nr:TraX family protein [Paenibacillus lentus]AZK48038.1 conjugal transfer protein TraX [Paenibacillus lentus]